MKKKGLCQIFFVFVPAPSFLQLLALVIKNVHFIYGFVLFCLFYLHFFSLNMFNQNDKTAFKVIPTAERK